MSILVVEQGHVPVSRPYPKLVVTLNGDTIVLADKQLGNRFSGVVLKGVGANEMGYSTSTWIVSSFRDYPGSITLTNTDD